MQKPRQIGFRVYMGVLDRIPHPGLRRQVNHRIERLAREQRLHPFAARDVQLGELESRMTRQTFQSRPLQARIVIRVQIIDSENLLVPGQQPLSHVVTDKPGRAGDQRLHFFSTHQWPSAMHSRPLRRKTSTASRARYTIGSPCRLKEVLSRIASPDRASYSWSSR